MDDGSEKKARGLSPNAKDITGVRYGMLVAKEPSHQRENKSWVWMWSCDCGNERALHAHIAKKSGHCGCRTSANCSKAKKTHGMSYTSFYSTWRSMIQRCNDKNAANYRNYGGRGISICERWMDFKNFREDMYPRPEGCSLDRIDVNGDYCPENCRWATAVQQANNRRTNRVLVIYGIEKTLKEWSDISALSYNVISDRIIKGIPAEDAVFEPLRSPNARKRRTIADS